MDLEIKKLMENWEYIQGGLLFLDETADRNDRCLELAQGELKHYINTLSVLQPKASSLIEALRLECEERSYKDIPESFRILLEQDISYLKENPSVMDVSYGSAAMAAFYEQVSGYLGIPSPTPGTMKQFLEETLKKELPEIQIIW